MPELRWNPVLKRWNIISNKWQDQPVLPEDSWPFCPDVLEVPENDYYIYIFENRRREIGVTLDHPHGQLYAFPFVLSLARRSVESAREHYEKENSCLFCSI